MDITSNLSEGLRTSTDHVLAELKRIEVKVQSRLAAVREQERKSAGDGLNGIFISETDIDDITRNLVSGRNRVEHGPETVDVPAATGFAETRETGNRQLECHAMNVQHEDTALRLQQLTRCFGLSSFEIDVLLLCLLPEIYPEYQRIFAYIQDDITRKFPTIRCVLDILGDSFADRLELRRVFSTETPLLKYNLVRFTEPPYVGHIPTPDKCMRVDERITDYLLDIDNIDPHLRSFTRLIPPAKELGDLILSDGMEQLLTRLVSGYKGESLVCHLRGPYGVGKRSVAEALCGELGLSMLLIDVDQMVRAGIQPENYLPYLFREGRLLNAALYFNGFDHILEDDRRIKPAFYQMTQELEDYSGLVFLGGEIAWHATGESKSTAFIDIEFPIPSFTERQKLWRKYWNGIPLSVDDDFSDVAGKFKFTGGQIRDAIHTALDAARWCVRETVNITAQDLYSACHKQSRDILSSMARKIQPTYCWEDIILPAEQMEQLREVCSYIKHYHMVYGSWGFEEKLALGKGLNALFTGPSGTGKTMAAEIICRELGLELYKIDLSFIVSKYIGETEKNLDRIFREGHASNVVLFFDEADALFGKRSEVRDSHDRYANIEVAYLLQKMDEYDGVVILATNLRKNMDDAFSRRMHFVIEFPVPEEPERYRIWESIFPYKAPLANDADVHFLARQFRITGGNIKNIALGAAFLAAEQGGCITTEYLIRATKREYQKIGKLCTEGEFERYYNLVKG